MKYKYSTEANLIFSLKKRQIAQQDEFDIISKDNFFDKNSPCTTYIICQRPRVTVSTKNFSFDKKHIRISFLLHTKCEKKELQVKLKNPYPDATYTLISDFPYNYVDIVDEEGTKIISGKSSYLFDELNKDKKSETLNYEVLYIGKSNAKEHETSSINRLISHKTLQKIYFDQTSKQPDKEIFFLLCNFDNDGLLFLSGSQQYQSTIESEVERFEKFNAEFHNMDRNKLLSLLEASLISYFKPKYNDHYKNSFLTKKQEATNHFINQDYNSFLVDIDTKDINVKLYSDNVKPSFIHKKDYKFFTESDRLKIF